MEFHFRGAFQIVEGIIRLPTLEIVFLSLE